MKKTIAANFENFGAHLRACAGRGAIVKVDADFHQGETS